jgi:pteridine reductase
MALNDQHILITGAAKRIGREIAVHLAKKGSNLALHFNHSQSEAEELGKEISNLGVNCSLIQGDLSTISNALTIIKEAEKWAPLSALINNASLFGSENFLSTTPQDWQKHIDINLTAPFFLSQQIIESAKQAKHQVRIINMLDWRALRPAGDHFAYTISKAALASLTKALASAAAPHAVVNGIALGAILPPKSGQTPKDILESIPLERWGRVEEVAQTVEFLLTGSNYITGEIIHLDGGRHLV